jgi:FKBP-type peptidyl-prolyl cis-trans isomerase FklB
MISARRIRPFKLLVQLGLCASLLVACSKPKAKAKAKASDDTAAVPAGALSAVSVGGPIGVPAANASALPFHHVPVTPESIPPPPLVPPADAIQGPGGVRYQVLKDGTGDSPGPMDAIVIDYNMWKGTGELALSSYTQDGPTIYNVSNLAPQFRSLLTSFKKGSKVRYWIPRAALSGWRPENWPDSDLIIEFEMLDVSHQTYHDSRGNVVSDLNPTLPPDAAGPPATATTTASGLKYIFTAHGAGDKHPGPDDRLALLVDAYAIEGIAPTPLEQGLRTATTLQRAPGHLNEILPLLVSGDRVRVWVPAGPAREIIPKAGARNIVLDLMLSF